MFSVSENGDSRLGDEGADGGNAPRILRLEPPWLYVIFTFVFHCSTRDTWHVAYTVRVRSSMAEVCSDQ